MEAEFQPRQVQDNAHRTQVRYGIQNDYQWKHLETK